MCMSFLILKFKDYKKDHSCKHCHSKNDIQSFHNYSSFLSSGVIKYASNVKTIKIMPIKTLEKRESFPVSKLPIAPAVSVYFAASANILPIVFLRSLFNLNKLYHKNIGKVQYSTTIVEGIMHKFKMMFLVLAILTLITNTAFAGAVQLPQTGQTRCYDSAGTEISCAGTGQDGGIQQYL